MPLSRRTVAISPGIDRTAIPPDLVTIRTMVPLPACPRSPAPTVFWESGDRRPPVPRWRYFRLAEAAPPAVPVAQPGAAPTSSAATTWPAILAETGHPRDSRRSVSLWVVLQRVSRIKTHVRRVSEARLQGSRRRRRIATDDQACSRAGGPTSAPARRPQPSSAPSRSHRPQTPRPCRCCRTCGLHSSHLRPSRRRHPFRTCPLAKTCTMSLLLNSPSRSASPIQVFFSSWTQRPWSSRVHLFILVEIELRPISRRRRINSSAQQIDVLHVQHAVGVEITGNREGEVDVVECDVKLHRIRHPRSTQPLTPMGP